MVAWQSAVERVRKWPELFSFIDRIYLLIGVLSLCWHKLNIGGYISQDCSDFPDAIIIATGSGLN